MLDVMTLISLAARNILEFDLGVFLLVKLNGTGAQKNDYWRICALRHKAGEIDPWLQMKFFLLTSATFNIVVE
jgi:hypothetical protein